MANGGSEGFVEGVLPPESIALRVRISPALALMHILPLVDLAPRFPGVDPWLVSLGSRLGREARADIRLLTMPLAGAARPFLRTPDSPESCEAGLSALAGAPAHEIHRMALEALAGQVGLEEPGDVARLLRDDPAELRQRMEAMVRPTEEEAYPIDWDRALRLLRQPEDLKALVVHRLGTLWHDHMAEPWRRRLDALERAAAEARLQLNRPSFDAVFQGVTGRDLGEEVRTMAARAGRLVFCPNPFLGPYVSLLDSEMGPDGEAGVWVGYGITTLSPAGPGGAAVPGGLPTILAGDPPAALPGGLPAALAAVADEGRLRLLAMVAARGEVTATDIMAAFGWSQPTTSRQLRQLVSTGWLRERWEDRVKRYRLDPSRVDQVASRLRELLQGDDR